MSSNSFRLLTLTRTRYSLIALVSSRGTYNQRVPPYWQSYEMARAAPNTGKHHRSHQEKYFVTSPIRSTASLRICSAVICWGLAVAFFTANLSCFGGILVMKLTGQNSRESTTTGDHYEGTTRCTLRLQLKEGVTFYETVGKHHFQGSTRLVNMELESSMEKHESMCLPRRFESC